jgi:phosphotriesterase-related protein
MSTVQTVTGPIDSADLGPTSVHEHLLIDLGCWFDEPADAEAARVADLRVGPETEATVRANPFAVRDNLVLDSVDVAAAELARFRAAGGRTIVDLTLDEIGRDPARLRELSERTGVQVVMGCGHYITRAHPTGMAERGVEALTRELLRDLTGGVGGVRAGVIGEIGTSDPVEPGEALVLTAACRAQVRTGVALFVHLDPWGRNGHDVLDRVEVEGVALDRVALCHLDPSLGDLGYARGLAARGAWVSIDIWGDEDGYGGRGMPTDRERTRAVRTAWDEGWAGRLLLAQDVCTKTQLHAHGGRGYDHLLTRVPELLREAGLPERAIAALLVDDPRRLLGGGAGQADVVPPK